MVLLIYLWSGVKDKCYADKSKAIDALKENIREVIGEIELHTIVFLKYFPKRRYLATPVYMFQDQFRNTLNCPQLSL